jgi:hypothetical protein
VYTLFAHIHLLPFPCHLPPPTSANHPSSLWAEHVLWFCRRKNIKEKTRNMTFLLVWDKDSYTESFLIFFPCIYVLQSQLVHLYQSSSLLPVTFPWWPWPA